MHLDEVKIMVQQLEYLGFYKYADPKDIDNLKEELTSSIANYGEPSTLYAEKNFIPLDYRLYLFDGKSLFKKGGFTVAMERMQPLFDKMHFTVNITDHVEVDSQNDLLNHRVTINGTQYIIFENFKGLGYGEAAQRFAEIINDQLELQDKKERLYLINVANDGLAIYLTTEQFNLFDTVLKDEHWKPLRVIDWCIVFEVDSMKYNRGSA